MTEIPFLFGPENSLVGIVTLPPQPADTSVACLLLNAGVLHRVGPHRINVKVARVLAAHGVASLRLDLAGLGDSEPSRSRRDSTAQSVEDLRAALDLMQREVGASRFLTIGICSGAVNSYHLALADPRVSGLFMFDGFFFPTLKTHLLRRWLRLTRQPISALAKAVTQSLASAVGGGHGLGGGPSPEQTSISRIEFERAMNELAQRDVAVFLGYSGSLIELYNYPTQLWDAFPNAPFLDRVECEYLTQIDHTVTTLAAQREFIDVVARWVARRLAAAPPAVSSLQSAVLQP